MSVRECKDLAELALMLAVSKTSGGGGSPEEIEAIVDEYFKSKYATEDEVDDVIDGIYPNGGEEEMNYATDDEIKDVIDGFFSGD